MFYPQLVLPHWTEFLLLILSCPFRFLLLFLHKRRHEHFSKIVIALLVDKNNYLHHWQKSWKDKSFAIMWPKLVVMVGLAAIFRQ